MLVSGVQQSDSVIHIPISIPFQILFPYRLLQDIEFPVLQSRSLWIIYLINSRTDYDLKPELKFLILPFLSSGNRPLGGLPLGKLVLKYRQMNPSF